jgi:hypothetical protein
METRTRTRHNTIVNGRKTKVSSHQELLSSLELTDAPNDGIFLWSVPHGTDACLELWRVSIRRNWNGDLNVVGC